MAVITVSLTYYAAVLFCNICSSFGNTEHESYIGCFYDVYDPQRGSSEGAVRVLPHANQKIINGMTIGTCFEYCSNEKEHLFPMQYAGVETGSECWCGRAEARYDLYGKRDDSDCMVQYCSGNPSQYCGDDFSIAVYNLTLARCQIPNIHGLDTSKPNFIPVYDNTTFTCLPGFQLSGPDTLQCIFDDDINDTRWASDLPRCLSIPATTSTTTITAAYSTSFDSPVTNSTMNTGTSEISSDNLQDYLIYIIGGVVGACIICVMICVLVILRSRSKRKTNQARQSNDMAMSSTSNGSTTKTQKDPPESSFPVYSQPIRPKSRGKSMMNETTATQEQTKPKTDETYSYADVHINPVTATASIDAVSNATQWAENNIYAGAEEPTEHEGWRDNNIYEAS